MTDVLDKNLGETEIISITLGHLLECASLTVLLLLNSYHLADLTVCHPRV